MLISVIIPHHEEDKKLMKPLLDSLNNQIAINFEDIEVFICNDSKEHIIDDFSEFPNLSGRVKNLLSPYESNPGMARQFGVDNATGEYILFCDCDDMLYSPTILYDLSMRIRSNADLYSFNFIEECRGKNQTVFNVKGHNEIWVFAKLYKTAFLRANNIRFSPDLVWHEDTYYNGIFFAHDPTVEALDYVGYIWRFNENSLTRQNNCEYFYTSLVALIDSADLVLKTVKSQKIKNLSFITAKAFDLIVSIYTKLQCAADEYRGTIEKRLVEFIKKYDPLLKCVSAESMGYISMALRQNLSGIPFVPQEGFVSFIIRIMQGENHEQNN